jgi:DNA end-binding protein Ku
VEVGVALSIWSGSVSFGLVNVPVKLFSAVRRPEVRVHQLAPDGPAAAKGHALPAAVMKDRERAQIVDSLSRDWDPRRYHDDYEEQLRAVIKAKTKRSAPRGRTKRSA